ncbi:MAG: Gfo/Idh/MocA family protein [Planctomycetota bacterium]|jgi:predicted dehydrogenase
MGCEVGGPLGYGLVGAGGFGRFCLEQYAGMQDIRLVAVADASPEAARAAADAAGVDACTFDELIARDDVAIVHVATPPFTHRELATRALGAGKHVLMEKPLAVTVEDGRAIVDAARSGRRVLAVNLIMRHNTLCGIVRRIVLEGLLGSPLRGYFENYAKGEPLPPDHWFWDRAKSGGIFIEHGVHFFDLFGWWLGEGEVTSAVEVPRLPVRAAARTQTGEGGPVDQVLCTCLYDGRVPVSFYHGFTQASRMDRQEMRLVFERGDITMYEWVPTRCRVDAILRDSEVAKLREFLPGCEVETVETYSGDARRGTARGRAFEVDRRVLISFAPSTPKTEVYGAALRGLLADMAAAVRDPSHRRLVTEADALCALKVAASADALAREG